MRRELIARSAGIRSTRSPGMSSTCCRPFDELRDALRRGDDQAAVTARASVEQPIAAVGVNDAFVKAALPARGVPAGPTRMALDPPTPAQLVDPAGGGRGPCG